jgi:hypothetical protein
LLKFTTTILAPVSTLILGQKVNYYANGFNNMINFEFKWDKKDYEYIFSKYFDLLNGELKVQVSLITYPLMMMAPHLTACVPMVYRSRNKTITFSCRTNFYGDESN